MKKTQVVNIAKRAKASLKKARGQNGKKKKV